MSCKGDIEERISGSIRVVQNLSHLPSPSGSKEYTIRTNFNKEGSEFFLQIIREWLNTSRLGRDRGEVWEEVNPVWGLRRVKYIYSSTSQKVEGSM